MSIQPLTDLLNRIFNYPKLEVVVELLLIGVVVYAIFRFVRGTRAAGALKGLLVVLAVATIMARLVGGGESFQRLAYLYDRFLALVAVGLVVIFQPELRRALVRLGEAPFFRGTPSEIGFIVDEICEATRYLSKSRFGAIIVIERSVGLAGLVEGGTQLNSALSSSLLQTIFYPGTALHDLAVVIKGKTVRAAGVQLPLAEPAEMPNPSFGSRHRAAVGLTKDCDAIVVVVSEETGHLRLAERGRLSDPLTFDQLRADLTQRLARRPQPTPATANDATPASDHPPEQDAAGDLGSEGFQDRPAADRNQDSGTLSLTDDQRTDTRERAAG